MIDIRYTLWIFQNNQSNKTINGNNYDFNITACTAQMKILFDFEWEALGSITIHTSDFFKHCLFCNKRVLLQQSQVKTVSCSHTCILYTTVYTYRANYKGKMDFSQVPARQCASTYMQLQHKFRKCLRNGGMVLGANRNNWQNIGAIP